MKIKRVRIDSFGGVQRFSTSELDDNMNLIYGPNESGKSTVSEFIRSTLFPSKFKYPSPAKTDSGTVEVVMDDGDTRTLVREYKKVHEQDNKKTVQEEFPGLDAETYRSIYGLDLTRLNDEKVLSTHDFKTRFLTVPGGENVPQVAEEIELSLDELMTRDRMTENKRIGGKLREIRDIDDEVVRVHNDIDRYETLAVEKALLEGRVEERKKLEILNKDTETRELLMDAQRKNIESLRELQAQRTNIERYRNFPVETRKQYDVLKARLDEIQKKLDEVPFGTAEESDLLSKSAKIQAAWDARPYYITNLEKINELEGQIEVTKKKIFELEEKSGYSVERSRKLRAGDFITDMATDEIMNRKRSTLSQMQKRILSLLVVLGVTTALLGIYFWFSMPDSSAGVLLSIVGFIVLVIGCMIPIFVKPSSKEIGDWNSWIVEQGYPEGTTPEVALELSQKISQMNAEIKTLSVQRKEVERLTTLVNDYESGLKPIFEKFNIPTDNYSEGMVQLLSLLRAVEDRKRNKPTTELESELEYTRNEFTALMKKFGGEKEYLRQYDLKMEIDRLDSEIRTLTESIEKSAGVPISELMIYLDGITENKVSVVEKYDVDDMNKRIGELQAQMDIISDDDRLHGINQRKMNAEDELTEMLREWAVLAVAKDLVANACSHFYSDLEPTVIKTANRYLHIMTEGRYKLDSDPRESSIVVSDAYMKKTNTQWSSGLGDQIYLSIKMAMAKEMGTERMPMILDDVLVRFDADRKESACRAIYEFSRDVQVLMFTCDNTLRNYFSLLGQFNEIHL